MQSQVFRGKILAVQDGWLVCPICNRNRRVKRITQDERAENLLLFCRDCKSEFRVDIAEGECFESRGR